MTVIHGNFNRKTGVAVDQAVVADFERTPRPDADQIARFIKAAQRLGYSEEWISDTVGSLTA